MRRGSERREKGGGRLIKMAFWGIYLGDRTRVDRCVMCGFFSFFAKVGKKEIGAVKALSFRLKQRKHKYN